MVKQETDAQGTDATERYFSATRSRLAQLTLDLHQSSCPLRIQWDNQIHCRNCRCQLKLLMPHVMQGEPHQDHSL